MSRLDRQTLQQYESFFGQEKMLELWHEYFNKAQSDLRGVASLNPEEQRLLYHSLRSSSLVFGMQKFAACCTAVEEAILTKAQAETLLPKIEEAAAVFEMDVQEVRNYLGIK